MSGIFISYRRADSRGWVTAIYQELIKHYSPDQIFRDISAIDYGADFIEAIEKAVQKCNVLLAVIGPQWSTITDKFGRRRLDDPHDLVRMEIVAALRRNIAVIPVLVDEAMMPAAAALPHDLRPLCRRNALEIQDRDFGHHMAGLVRAIGRTIASANVSVVDLLSPPFDWVTIPSGQITLNISIPGHMPAGPRNHRFSLASYEIAKYPITNAQFQLFVDAEDGYCERKWWRFSDDALAWRESIQDAIHTGFLGDDMPRTNVTWYEAMAFCAWLSAISSDNVGLPNELQWQRAAQGNDRRKYPWGNEEPNDTLCNIDGSAGKTTTPVTLYPAGISPYGVMDMIGNVWEWCLNQYRDPQHADIRRSGARVLKGGSWENGSWISYRCDLNAEYRSGDTGFRIARVAVFDDS